MQPINVTPQRKIGPFPSSDREIKDLAKAWIVISIAFGLVMRGMMDLSFFEVVIVAAITVGTGFLLHELAHKVVAQRYGCFAEFRSFDSMLLLALAMSFFGVIFAAPGAVMIAGPVGKKRNGIISVAGPITNLILAALFLVFLFLNPTGLLWAIAVYGFLINSWLALFNMIPVWNLDGAKVWRWNKHVWVIVVAIALGFMLLQGAVV